MKPDTWQICLLYDGACPLCAREIGLLKRLDRGRGRIRFEDITEVAFDAHAYGLGAAPLLERIHGVLPDGSVVDGVEVFRRAYAAVGLGWLLVPTGWPGLRGLVDRAYESFARNRLRWTGRLRAGDAERCGNGSRRRERRRGQRPKLESPG